ncbi:MAG: response regulator transcription factor [Acidimicrobiia bacterium]|nr:response regulator transcription factor [Acidimicrobiia bacterium]
MFCPFLYACVVEQHRILIVEDDERIGSSLLRALNGSGYDTAWEQTGQAGLDAVAERRPDLILLDLGLPDGDGIEVCGHILDIDPSISVVMLTARDEELDVVVGLDAGAIDYVAKPFKLAELLARVRAQLRRRPLGGVDQLSAGDLVIDVAARRVWLSEQEVELRAKEFDLLARLADDAGAVVTRETLMSDVWDEHWFGSTKTLDFHIAALRRKIDAPGEISRISTLRGVGYRLELP